jgi:phosphatidylinositol alpha 1,6-mannosyltransferase
MSMRIALVAESYLPDVNGVARSTERVAHALLRAGHEPVVIAPEPAPGSSVRDAVPFPVVRVPSKPWPKNPRIRIGLPSPRVAEALLASEPDVAYLAGPYLMGGRAASAAREARIPTVALYFSDPAMIVGQDASASVRDRTWAQLRSVHAMVDRNLAPTPSAARVLADQGFGPVQIWDQGVDVDGLTPRRRSPRLRRALASDGELLVGYVGRLSEEKQIDLLARAASLPGVRLVLVGDGPDRDRLRRLLPDAMFLGIRRGRALARLYATFDVFVHPGAYETFGLTVREAQASGAAVIAPDRGGAADLIDHGVTGLRFSAHDSASLAARLALLESDRGAVARLGAAARAAVEQCTWDAAAERLVTHLRSVSEQKEAAA